MTEEEEYEGPSASVGPCDDFPEDIDLWQPAMFETWLEEDGWYVQSREEDDGTWSVEATDARLTLRDSIITTGPTLLAAFRRAYEAVYKQVVG